MEAQDLKLWGSDAELPSRGMLYDGKIPEGTVTVVPMTTLEEKILAGSNPQTAIQALDMLIARCVPTLKEQGLTPSDLISGDRFYLLMAIRAVTYGTEYQFQVVCESCNLRFKHTINVPDDFVIEHLPEGFVEPFEVSLPMSKATLGMRIARGSDEVAISKYLDQIYKKLDRAAVGDPAFTYRVMQQVLYIKNQEGQQIDKGTKDFETKCLKFLDALHGNDMRAIRQAVIDNDCGPNTEVECQPCPKCRHINVFPMPYSVEFFRPGSERRRG